MPRLLLTIYLFMLPAWMAAQQKLRTDSAVVATRNFSGRALDGYKGDSAFQYERAAEPPVSLWERFWSWFWNRVGEMLKSKSGWNIFSTICIIAGSAVLLFFILKLTGMTNAGLFGKENTSDTLGYSVYGEDIHGIDFDAAIEEAVNNRNFRFAVRLLYLQSLKRLADLGLIKWQLNKTNVAYLQELSGSKVHRHFTNLTFQFENNWYGDLPIEEDEFRAVKEQFSEFAKQLH